MFIRTLYGSLRRHFGMRQNLRSRPSNYLQKSQYHGSYRLNDATKSNRYKVTFKTADGEEIVCFGKQGEHLLDIAHGNNVDLEGACEASLACSTCHVIVESADYFNKIPEASDEENDMLDLAFGLTEKSRLGCQVKMCKELDGIVVRIPSATRNMAVDGFKPKPH